MSKSIVSKDAGRDLAQLLTRDRVKRIVDSKSQDPDLEQLRAVVRRAKAVRRAPKASLLVQASKYLS